MGEAGGGSEIQETGESSGKVSWIYSKGLALGKGILVTGVAISSAPLVLPPLLVFSAIGFACAVPCGLYLASYACTEKLMSTLLPGTRAPRFLLDCETRDDVTKGIGVVENVNMEKDEEEQMEDTKHGVKRRLDLLEEANEEEERVSSGDAYHYEHSGFEKNEEELEENASENSEVNGYEEDMGEYVNHEKQMSTEVEIEGSLEEEKEAPVAVKSESRAPASEVRGLMIVIEGEDVVGTNVNKDAPFEVTSVAVEFYEGQDSGENEELERETRRLIEKIRDDDEVDKIEGKQGGVVIHEGVKEDAVENIEQDQKTGVDNAAILLEEQKQDDSISKDTRQEASAELPEESEHSSSLEQTPTFDKTVYSEEKIWNQLNAMRTIVGYTASPRASCVEELKALYIFTGVEPPELFKDPPDLVEVNDKLRFLMSIVGVK